MPDLDISPNDLLSPTTQSLDRVGAVMLWPDDAPQRGRAIEAAWAHATALRAQTATTAATNVTLDTAELASMLARLAAAPSLGDARVGLSTALWHGFIAGWILRDVIGRGANASIKRAIGSASAMLKETKNPIQPTEKTIKNTIWPRSKCVSHLWAACIDLIEHPAAFPCRVSDFGRFLALAEWYLKAGTAPMPHRQNVPLIDGASSWRVPPAVPLPAIETRVVFT